MADETSAGPAPAQPESIEVNLRRLAVSALALIFALAATLFVVQLVLGRQLDNLAHRALARQHALNAVESAVGALFRRQAQVLGTTAEEQLKPLDDRAALEAKLEAARVELAGSGASSADSEKLRADIGRVLETDRDLFASIARRHQVNAAFEAASADVGKQLRSIIEGTHGVRGVARLEYMLILRHLKQQPGNVPLVRQAVLGAERAEQDLASDLVSQILTMGVLTGKIGLAASGDALNSIMANEVAQNVTATKDALHVLVTLAANLPAIADRARELQKSYEAALQQISAEANPRSMISLRRAYFVEKARAEQLRAASAGVGQALTANVSAIGEEVSAFGRTAAARGDRTILLTRLFSLLLLAGGIAVCVKGARRIRSSVERLRESNRTLEELKNSLVTINANLEGLVAQRTKALSEREQAMRLVLDNTGDGLIPLGLDAAITGQVSRAAKVWIGEPGDGQKLWDYLFADDARGRGLCSIGFMQLTDGFLPFEVAADQMPARIERDGRILAIAYRPIRSGEEMVGILVALTDVTAQVAAERREEEARELQAMVGNILQSAQGFQSFVTDGEELLATIEQTSAPSSLPLCKRALHTLKGNAAIYGVRSIAQVCHQIEDAMIESGGGVPELSRARLRRAWDEVLARVKPYLDRDHGRVNVEPGEVETVKELLRAGAEPRRILALLDTWAQEPMGAALERMAAQARRIGSSIGKKVEVAVEHDGARMPAALVPFWSALVHVVRNAVDHGLETPEEREAAGKAPAGTLTLRARHREDQTFELVIADDGAGLRMAELQARAQAMGLPSSTEREVLDAMFADGLSTKDAVSELSGRGVGLSAVRAACQQLGGRVSVRSSRTDGTSFTFVFPAGTVSAGRPRPMVAA